MSIKRLVAISLGKRLENPRGPEAGRSQGAQILCLDYPLSKTTGKQQAMMLNVF